MLAASDAAARAATVRDLSGRSRYWGSGRGESLLAMHVEVDADVRGGIEQISAARREPGMRGSTIDFPLSA